MHVKILMVLLALLPIGYSVAPAWVNTGVNLNYSAGSDAISFTVVSRSAEDIHLQLYTLSTDKTTHPVENASADSGQFWFDTSLLSGASPGTFAGAYSVTDAGRQSFAGTDWDTVTLQSTVSGVVTTKVLDRSTGLMLKETFSAAGAPTVTLVKYYIPGISPAPPQENSTTPAQPPANQTPPADNQTHPADNQTPSQPGTPGNGSAQPGTNGTQAEPPAPQSPSAQQKKCCLSGFVLLLIGFAALRKG